MQPLVIVPIHIRRGLLLHLRGVLPDPIRVEVDELGLVQPDRRFHHRVVQRVPDGADRPVDPGLGQRLRKRQGGVLPSGVAVVYEPVGGELHLRVLPGEQGVLQGHEHHLGVHGRGGHPAQNHPRVGVDDERGVAEPVAGSPDVGEVRDPPLHPADWDSPSAAESDRGASGVTGPKWWCGVCAYRG